MIFVCRLTNIIIIFIITLCEIILILFSIWWFMSRNFIEIFPYSPVMDVASPSVSMSASVNRSRDRRHLINFIKFELSIIILIFYILFIPEDAALNWVKFLKSCLDHKIIFKVRFKVRRGLSISSKDIFLP